MELRFVIFVIFAMSTWDFIESITIAGVEYRKEDDPAYLEHVKKQKRREEILSHFPQTLSHREKRFILRHTK